MLIRKFKNLSIRIKIQLITLLSIIVLSVVSFLGMHQISESHNMVLYNTLSGYLSYSGKELKSQLEIIDTITDTIFANEIIQNKLIVNKNTDSSSEKSVAQSEIYRILSNYIMDFSNNGLSYITIAQGSDTISTSMTSINNIPEDLLNDLIHEGQKGEGSSRLITKYSTRYGIFFVKEIRRIENLKLDSLGILIINIDLAKLINTTLAAHSQYEDTHYILFDEYNLMYNNTNISKSAVAELMSDTDYRYRIVHTGNTSDLNDIFAVYGTIPEHNWKFIIMVPYDTITHTIQMTTRLSVILTGTCIFIILLVSSAILKNLTGHLDRLISKMHSFGKDEFTPSDYNVNYTKREDEIGLLHNTFDRMAIQIKELLEQNYINELLKKEAQIQAMESQMDPHFLYNTLDSINWRAKVIKAVEISDATVALGNLLRITLDTKQTDYTIAKEIKTLNYYFTIQKMRYPNRLKYQIDIPNDLFDCEIPKLTVQPLVENSIRYGLESMSEVCNITVTALQNNKNIQIEIKNNGSSFEDNLLDDLLNNRRAPHGFGVGIKNIHRRLKLTYGNAYGLYLYNIFDSETGEEYSVVRMTIPLICITKKL